jgi:hypothetical protein
VGASSKSNICSISSSDQFVQPDHPLVRARAPSLGTA